MAITATEYRPKNCKIIILQLPMEMMIQTVPEVKTTTKTIYDLKENRKRNPTNVKIRRKNNPQLKQRTIHLRKPEPLLRFHFSMLFF